MVDKRGKILRVERGSGRSILSIDGLDMIQRGTDIEVICSDELFNAYLCHVGTMGVVTSVVLLVQVSPSCCVRINGRADCNHSLYFDPYLSLFLTSVYVFASALLVHRMLTSFRSPASTRRGVRSRNPTWTSCCRGFGLFAATVRCR